MEDIFRGQRAAGAPVPFTAKAASTFCPPIACWARGRAVPRGYGNYFRSGTSAARYRQAGYVVRRLRSSMDQEASRHHLRAGNCGYAGMFNRRYLYGLPGTIRYPRRFKPAGNIVIKPYAENRTFP